MRGVETGASPTKRRCRSERACHPWAGRLHASPLGHRPAFMPTAVPKGEFTFWRCCISTISASLASAGRAVPCVRPTVGREVGGVDHRDAFGGGGQARGGGVQVFR